MIKGTWWPCVQYLSVLQCIVHVLTLCPGSGTHMPVLFLTVGVIWWLQALQSSCWSAFGKACLFIFGGMIFGHTKAHWSCFDLWWLTLQKYNNEWSYGALSLGDLLSITELAGCSQCTVWEVFQLHRESGSVHDMFVQPHSSWQSLNQHDISYISPFLDFVEVWGLWQALSLIGIWSSGFT